MMRLIVLVFSLSLFASAGQAGPPQFQLVPLGGFERVDVLEHVDFAGRQVMIGDRMYPMSPDMRWHGLRPGQRPRDALLQLLNRNVGYTLAWKEQTPQVTSIWVLPRESDLHD